MKTGIIRNVRFMEHKPPGYHPENPQRLKVIYDYLDKNWSKNFVDLTLRSAQDDEILLIHSQGYLSELKKIEGRSGYLDPDTYYSQETLTTALLAAGSVLNAVDAIVSGKVESAFALVRPPGHHAERNRAMGFCIFNNAAIAARYIQKVHGLKRILIVDWDLHHGNGTQYAFYNDPQVLYFSIHQYPYYPGTGAINECGTGNGEGFNINVPIPQGMGDRDYLEFFNRILIPVTDEFKPEFVIISAGFDAHKDDPLGNMALTEDGYSALTGIIMEIAKKYAGGKLLLSLEGGYNLEALRNSIISVLETLEGVTKKVEGIPSETAIDITERVIKFIKKYWANL